MYQDEDGLAERISSLLKQGDTLVFLVKPQPPYDPLRPWLSVDGRSFAGLSLRALDDLSFPDGPGERVVEAFTTEPPHAAGATAIALPTQAALERIFFHIQGITRLVVNPTSKPAGLSHLQRDVEYAVPDDLPKQCEFSHEELPELIGAFACRGIKKSKYHAHARKAYKENSLFESFFCARQLRREKATAEAWYLELLFKSFLGSSEQALELYESYPDRGSTEIEPLFLAARYRLLLKQYNEACTILHTLTFKAELASQAFTELARAFVMTGEFGRAIDAASAAIERDPQTIDAYLVRGLAYRGLSYADGVEDGLRSALKDFELVATRGVFSSAEALFHAGTVFARLGDLQSAESSLRQSLFQRDRFASRDALVRVLCAGSSVKLAREETALLGSLLPEMVKPLHDLIDVHSGAGSDPHQSVPEVRDISGSLYSFDRDEVREASRKALSDWRIPVQDKLSDCCILDEFLNYYAPAGLFSENLEHRGLNDIGVPLVARALAVHVMGLMVDGGLADWISEPSNPVIVAAKPSGGTVPLEAFVHDRILLGASADNFAALESLLAEVATEAIDRRTANSTCNWRIATSDEVAAFSSHAEWAREKVAALGFNLAGSLSDLTVLDEMINISFEPGGGLSERGAAILEGDRERFITGIGFLLGRVITEALPGEWYSHPDWEGVSLLTTELGRIFPIARVQRRAYLGAAADFSAQLGSFAFGVGAAVVSREIREGILQESQQTVERLLELLPALKDFPEAEISALASSLLINR